MCEQQTVYQTLRDQNRELAEGYRALERKVAEQAQRNQDLQMSIEVQFNQLEETPQDGGASGSGASGSGDGQSDGSAEVAERFAIKLHDEMCEEEAEMRERLAELEREAIDRDELRESIERLERKKSEAVDQQTRDEVAALQAETNELAAERASLEGALTEEREHLQLNEARGSLLGDVRNVSGELQGMRCRDDMEEVAELEAVVEALRRRAGNLEAYALDTCARAEQARLKFEVAAEHAVAGSVVQPAAGGVCERLEDVSTPQRYYRATASDVDGSAGLEFTPPPIPRPPRPVAALFGQAPQVAPALALKSPSPTAPFDKITGVPKVTKWDFRALSSSPSSLPPASPVPSGFVPWVEVMPGA